MADPFDDNEKPLDPAVARVRQKLGRLMLIAGLTLGIGILAVFGGIVYRLSLTEPGAPAPLPKEGAVPTVSLSALGLPPDARIVSAALDGDTLALTYADGNGTTVIIFRLPEMAVVSRLRVTAD